MATASVRRAIAAQRAGYRKTNSPVGRPAPVGGWNVRDAQDVMPPTDAIQLDNIIPRIGKVSLREGTVRHVGGVGSGDVEMISEFHVGTMLKMIASGGGAIYDATSSAVSSLGSGFTDDRWNTIVFDSKMGFVNGFDTPQQYDGSTLTTLSITGSGLTASSIMGINAFRSRTYAWMKNSADVYYSAVNALGGSMTKFPLSRLNGVRGNLIAMGTWNPQGGADWWGGGGAAPDLAVFVMSSGQCIVYEGDDPGSNWSLKAVHEIGRPIDPRAICRIGSDLLIPTTVGLQSMNAVVSGGRVSGETDATDKIEGAIHAAATQWGDSVGWQCIYSPGHDLMIINVPRGGSTDFEQYVMNASTKAWCRFTDLNARCWGVFDGGLYWGSNDGTIKKYEGVDDEGDAIRGEAQTPYDYFGQRGTVKTAVAVRPVLVAAGNVDIGIKCQVDHQVAIPTVTTITFSTLTNWEDIDVNWEDWDEDWDMGGLKTVAPWFAAGGTGYAIGAHIVIEATDEVEWHSMTYLLKPGQGMKGGGPV